MKFKHQEDIRLTQYLNKFLDDMPLDEPSSTLTDRVMRSLHAPENSFPPKASKAPRRKEWMNSIVAIAATVVLIQSGIISKIMNLDSEVTQLTTYIQKLSQFLQF
ncbi:hypothetical protein [Paenibacillus sp. N3.4]|uniref:hypothetical protein n=1 Tax=Paenibacillus sp. N3.4 TaxID=2603222 RepID=UPI0011C804E5|nr:hypothetical protein [Paenibacillus sp. N3.4]TXK79600.1 hypothetical protein FU659_19475 [Paenibacillus sp. N3.4]